MRDRQKAMLPRKALATLVVMGALGLQPLGIQAAEPPPTLRGKLQSGDLSYVSGTSCVAAHALACYFFSGGGAPGHPDPCFNNNATLPRQNLDLRKEIFGADPAGNPAEESWGSKYPFANVKDLSQYTDRAARAVKFTLEASQGYPVNGERNLTAFLFDANCQLVGAGTLELKLVVGETLTRTIPRRTKWFLLTAGNIYLATALTLHVNETWRMTFQ